MIQAYYDLHIHSALSPCANNDMTPNDIVGMALLNNLDIIAVTDHNSFANVSAVLKAAQTEKIIVLPGIEVATVEEVHVICLFTGLDKALLFDEELTPYYSLIPNRIDIFGNQYLMDERDMVTGELERMLIAPTSISFDDLYFLTHKYGGAFIPAHIDRNTFSVISNLGFLPPHLSINTVEISPNGYDEGFDKHNTGLFAPRNVVFSSDAHQLWVINERKNFFMLPDLCAETVIDYLR